MNTNKTTNRKNRSRKARIGIMGAGVLAAAITLGVAAPSMAAETTTTTSSTSQEAPVTSVFEKSVKMDLTNNSASNVELHHRASNQQKSTHTTLDSGASISLQGHSAVGTDVVAKLIFSSSDEVYVAAKNPTIGSPSVYIGTSSTNNNQYTFSNSGDSVEVDVNGHTVKVTYNDGDYKNFTVSVS